MRLLPNVTGVFPLRDAWRSSARPLAVYLLCAVMLGVFAYQLALGARVDRLFFQHGVVPLELIELRGAGVLLTPVTSAFLHGSWVHLALNLFFFVLFGRAVAEALGPGRFAIAVIVSAYGAAALQVLVEPTGEVPLIGASGAITGVLGAHVRLFPQGRVIVLVPLRPFVREVPAAIVVASWFVLQLLVGFSAWSGPASGGITFFAHVGGFVAGLWIVTALPRIPNETRGFRRPEPSTADPRHLGAAPPPRAREAPDTASSARY